MFLRYITLDCIRYCERTNIKACINTYIRCHSFWMRLASYNDSLQFIARIIRRHYSVKYGLHIIGDNIAYGFKIGHSFGTIINPKTIIGDNCTVVN